LQFGGFDVWRLVFLVWDWLIFRRCCVCFGFGKCEKPMDITHFEQAIVLSFEAVAWARRQLRGSVRSGPCCIAAISLVL